MGETMIAASLVVWSMLAAASPVETAMRAVAALPGEPRIVSAAGVTREETPILTIENSAAFDPIVTKRRLAIVGSVGADEAAARNAGAVVAAVRWFKTRAPRALRRQWAVSALPSARFESSDTQSLSRWITFQAPDLVVTVGDDPVEAAVPSVSIGTADTIAALQKLMMIEMHELGRRRQGAP